MPTKSNKKDSCYRLETLAFYDHVAIQKHLEAMALKGWLIGKPGNLLWRYRSIAPQKLHISVTYFPDASAFDPGPTSGQQIMEEYALKDGWQLAARWGQMQIFYNESANPTPIETDAVTQVETIHRAMKKTMLPNHIAILVLCALQISLALWQLASDPTEFFSTPASLYMAPAWIFLALSTLLEIGSYCRWHRKAAIAAEDNGSFPTMRANHIASWLLILLSILSITLALCSSTAIILGILAWLVILLILLLTVGLTKRQLKRKGVSRKANFLVSMGLTFILTFVFGAGTLLLLIRFISG